MAEAHTTLDRDEVARFARLAGEWWDADGPFKPLHRINPVRLTYIRDQLCRTFGRDKKAGASLEGLKVLDIGCGGGLVAEPLAGSAPRSPASTRRQRISKPPSPCRGRAARHCLSRGTAEALAAEGASFDAVLCSK